MNSVVLESVAAAKSPTQRAAARGSRTELSRGGLVFVDVVVTWKRQRVGRQLLPLWVRLHTKRDHR